MDPLREGARLHTTVEEWMAAWRQQIDGDRMFGLREVPVVLPGRGLAEGVSGARVVDAATRDAKAAQLHVIDEREVQGCRRCELCKTRTRTVFGQGDPAARLVFVGEAPGFDEDRQGLAFVGRAGQLLTRMIAAMGLTRDEVFICNVLKCRPPENRDPLADEVLACSPYLFRQLAIIDPQVIVALGSPAAKTLLNTAESIGRLRGRFHDFYLEGGADPARRVPLMPTYHPAYLLRNPGEKRKAWEDLQQVMELMNLKMPVGGTV